MTGTRVIVLLGIMTIARILVAAWLLMLGVGVLRGEWLSQLPTIGLSGALLITVVGYALYAVLSTRPDMKVERR